jgi:hypothetical protein
MDGSVFEQEGLRLGGGQAEKTERHKKARQEPRPTSTQAGQFVVLSENGADASHSLNFQPHGLSSI